MNLNPKISTILNADKIYVIEKGQVISEGKHDDLLKSSKVYLNFYEKQTTEFYNNHFMSLLNYV